MPGSTIIGPSTHIEGGLRGQDDLQIEGRVDGPVVGEAAVSLGAGSQVGGDVWGREVTIAGVLKHDVHASHAVHLLSTAEVYGQIVAPRITVDDGAVLEGQVKITRAIPAQLTEPTIKDERRATRSPMRQIAASPPPPPAPVPAGPRQIPDAARCLAAAPPSRRK